MDIILAGGLWLDGSAWDAVTPELESDGHRAVALTLPGQGDGDATATLDDQVATVVAAIDAAAGPPLLVGHSAASSLVWIAADQRADKVAGVVVIGGMPVADGQQYAPFFPLVAGAMPFPGWEPFAGADSADLDDAAKARIADAAIAVPGSVAHATVNLGDDRRYDLPVFMICPEYSPQDAQDWIDAGEIPELSKPKRLQLVDIDSGHWPMFSAPTQLGRLMADIADTLA